MRTTTSKRLTDRLDDIDDRLTQLARQQTEEREQSERLRVFCETVPEARRALEELYDLDEPRLSGERGSELVHDLLGHMADYHSSTGIWVMQ